jgi:TonB C terminal
MRDNATLSSGRACTARLVAQARVESPPPPCNQSDTLPRRLHRSRLHSRHVGRVAVSPYGATVLESPFAPPRSNTSSLAAIKEFIPGCTFPVAAALLVVVTHAAVIQILTNKRHVVTVVPALIDTPLEVFLSPLSESAPVTYRMPNYRWPRTQPSPPPTLATISAKAMPSSFAITVPAAEPKTNVDTLAVGSTSARVDKLRLMCGSVESRFAHALSGARTLEVLVRVEPDGQLSAVKIARSSGSASFDAAIADCVLAHGKLDMSRPEVAVPIWQRMVWNDP